MNTVFDIFQKPFPRPEPEQIQAFSLDEIISTVIQNPHFIGAEDKITAEERIDDILTSKTYTIEVPHLLPYIEELCQTILRRYPQHRILIAARDAEPFYDALKITLRDNPRYEQTHLFAGSSVLMDKVAFKGKMEAVKQFLARYGITEESVKAEHFLLFDTGFLGTIGESLRKAVQTQFDIPGERAVDIGLVARDKTSYVHGKELKQVPLSIRKTVSRFPKTMTVAASNLRYYSRNFPIAVALQLLPRYHGPFVNIDDSGTPLASYSYTAVTINQDIDRTGSINASIINPVAAMLVQKRVVDYFTERREHFLAGV
ncbi:hypothetical protein HYT55_01315 [Candidatus Woesearchaeota archaeon]|nr:hypothetical protein [Candidatus Woesearchaeota archaeon]